jgi:monovalent cation/hydrogen antiporter
MPATELVLGLLVAVTVLAMVARWLNVPYPILLVLGGLVLSFVPGLPPIKLDPDIVLLVFLPPLITAAGWYTSVQDLRTNRRAIGFLSVGLVLFTTFAVAAVAHALIPALGWGPALLLGAIVSPTDAVAAAAVLDRMGAPHRLIAVLEGESLLNDATGLVAYRFAVVAIVTGSFVLWKAGALFVLSIVAGVGIGLAVGWLLVQAWRRIEDPILGIILSFLAPYAAFVPADRILGVSGVLAVAVSGIYASRRSSAVISAAARVQAMAVWELVVFVLNGLAFILIGLQLHQVVASLSDRPPWDLLRWAAAICLTVIVGRILWIYPTSYLPRFLSRRLRERDPYPSWRQLAVASWSGMRGVVSLAAALAIPTFTSGTTPFPHRDLVIFLTFSVILVTLVGQGLSLPVVLRALRVTADESEAHEEARARFRALESALSRLNELALQEWTTEAGINQLRAEYEKRRHYLSTRLGKLDHDHSDGQVRHTHDGSADHLQDHRARQQSLHRLKQELVDTQRATIIQLRNEGLINDRALRRVERDLDLEELRLGGS